MEVGEGGGVVGTGVGVIEAGTVSVAVGKKASAVNVAATNVATISIVGVAASIGVREAVGVEATVGEEELQEVMKSAISKNKITRIFMAYSKVSMYIDRIAENPAPLFPHVLDIHFHAVNTWLRGDVCD